MLGVFVVMHTGPHRSVLPHLLSSIGQHPATFAEDGAPIEAWHIYVAPPDHHMVLGPDRIRLDQGPKIHHTRPEDDRSQLRKALDQLDAGDVLMVTRLDRLARSTRDLLNTLATITDRKAGFRSLGDTWADTTSAHGRLMLTVLGGLAEFERELDCECRPNNPHLCRLKIPQFG
jgi:hypothetical protein